MIGILVVTHGRLAEGLMDSVELIMGKQTDYKTLSLKHGDDITSFGKKIKEAIIQLDKGKGVLVFTDLFAASPYNQTAAIYKDLKNHDYRSISGVNLPMLLESFGRRLSNESLEEITSAVIETGKGGIKELFTELKK